MKKANNTIKLNEHMKMVLAELQKEQNKPAKRRDYFYIKLLREELGFEMECILNERRF